MTNLTSQMNNKVEKFSHFLPHHEPQEIDKSLDIHLIPNDLDSAMKRAPSKVEYLEWLISLSMVRHKSPVVPFSENLFLSNCLVDYNSIDFHLTMALVRDSTLSGHATTPIALVIHMNNELDFLYFLHRK